MANVFPCLIAICCALSVLGCGPHSQGSVQQPKAGQQSAIAFAQQVMKDLSTHVDKLIIPPKPQIKDEGDYLVMRGEAHALTAKNIMSDFARFCQSLQGAMVGQACRRGTGDEVKFLVYYSTGPMPGGYKTLYEQISVKLEVYEPVGAPSPKFLQAIRPYGYKTVADREAEERARQQREAQERARREREAQEAAEREKPLTTPTGAPSASSTPSAPSTSAPASGKRSNSSLQKAFDKQ